MWIAAATGMNRNRLLRSLAFAAGSWALYRLVRRRRRRLDLAGAVALVTGSSRGLGLAIAAELSRRGARVALMARTRSDLDGALARLAGLDHREVIALAGDVADPDDAYRAVVETIDAFGRIDILINNAGVISCGPLETVGRADFARAMDTHFWGPFHMMSGALPSMIERGGGRIVNITSIGGKVAVPHLAAYTASKFALVGLSNAFRAELASRGIYVTTVVPGLMRTGSHVNAEFTGDHQREYAWFAIADSMPGLTMSAQRAASLIVDACRDGDPHLTLGIAARAAVAGAALAPDLTAEILALIDRVLPSASGASREARTGWESTSRLAPSLLTRRADRVVVPLNELRGHRAAELRGGDDE